MARIETYLPALNRVCAVTSQGPVWHDITKDVRVDDVREATCPITGDEVQTGKAAGVTVFFRPLQLDSPLAAAAAADQLPVHPMSDALREAGDDAAADDLNDTFSLV